MALSPYDRLFRRIFSSPEAGADLARNVLPSRYLQEIELGSVHLEKESFIDDDLKEHFSDLLMVFERKDTQEKGKREESSKVRDSRTTHANEPLYLYLLVDHKSSPDRWVPFQLLRYVGNIYGKIQREHRRRNAEAHPSRHRSPPQKMPEVVPVVFYHGTERWKSPLETERLIDRLTSHDPESAVGSEAEHIPRFTPIFYDLREIEDQRLLGSVHTVVGLVCLKYIRRKFTEEIARTLIESIRRLPPESGLAKAIYTALAAAKEREEINLFLAKARELRYTEVEEGVMTFAQEVREEGLKEGIKVGIREGETLGKMEDKQEIVKRQLSKKFGLSQDEAEAIDRVDDLAALDAALDEIIDAAEKRQVMGKLGL